jgi:hypothetical protein
MIRQGMSEHERVVNPQLPAKGRVRGTGAIRSTVFLGAFLLFLVEPLIAKQILPWFGGAPAVWSTCLVFFQLALVVGYGYAHVTRRLGLRRQAILHGVLLILTLATLPILLGPSWKPTAAQAPFARVLVLLTVSVGAPFVLLSATAPMLQDWFRQMSPSRTPYRLYVLSNAGSLVALVAYPALVERFLTIPGQAWGWSAGFALFTALCLWCARQAAQTHAAANAAVESPSTAGPAASRSRVAALDAGLWTLLAACGSGLLVATTNQLCQNVAVVPLLWIVPLALYLLTFIVSFAEWYRRRWWVALYALGVSAAGYVLANPTSVSIALQAAGLLAALTACCMVCHGELVAARPDARHLTAFYLALAIGGALGGLFVALAAPVLFSNYVELPLLLLLVPVLLVAAVARTRLRQRGGAIAAVVVLAPIGIFVIAAVAALDSGTHGPNVVASERNFYGILRVVDDPLEAANRRRVLYNGRILHGSQFLDPTRRLAPTTYYGPGSGIDLALRERSVRVGGRPLRVGVVGLGTATIAAWGRPGDRFRFFEINPDVVRFAREDFAFLSGSRASVDVVLGDARLSIEREVADPMNRRTYDVLAIDAFSGDSVPVHLLTRECFTLYREALATDGVLALHVSNQYLDLTQVVRGLSADAGWEALEVNRGADPALGVMKSKWMLATADAGLAAAVRPLATPLAPGARSIVWTDAYSSLVSVLR